MTTNVDNNSTSVGFTPPVPMNHTQYGRDFEFMLRLNIDGQPPRPGDQAPPPGGQHPGPGGPGHPPGGDYRVDTGSGDDQVYVDSQGPGNYDIDTGSGDDKVVIGRPSPDSANDNRGVGEESNDPLQQLRDKYETMLDKLKEMGEESNGELQQVLEKFENMLDEFMEELENLLGQKKPQTRTDTGSGDDKVDIVTGGDHDVQLGSGDDHAFVDFKDGDSGNNATIHGGSGNDTVTLQGSESDYSVSSEDGYSVYTDKDGNTIQVADDVENVRFENGGAASETAGVSSDSQAESTAEGVQADDYRGLTNGGRPTWFIPTELKPGQTITVQAGPIKETVTLDSNGRFEGTGRLAGMVIKPSDSRPGHAAVLLPSSYNNGSYDRSDCSIS